MVKLILISLQAIIAINAVLSTNVPAGNGLKYIGSFRSRLSVQGRSTQLFDESNYYISQNWGAYNTAQKDCESQLNANLLAVETEEEWKYVREMLKNYGFGTAYWTSGEYAQTEWQWSANNIALAPFAPWEKGHPKKANPLLSVLINFRNRYDATWSTVPNTQLHRYICEEQVHDSSASSHVPPSTSLSTTPSVPPSTSPSTTLSVPPTMPLFTPQDAPTVLEACHVTNNLMIVLGSSESIGSDNYEKAKEFVNRLAGIFTVHSLNGVWQYSAGVSTNVDDLIKLGLMTLKASDRGVPINMVFFTGVSSLYETTAITEQAIKYGIRTFSVGITPYINQHQMLEMAGNDSSRVFTSENADDLMNLLAPLSHKICSR